MANSNKTKHNNDMLEIQMLGDFVLYYNDKTISGEKMRSKQVWNLLEYILVNRQKEISMDRLIQVLWKDDDVEDPSNALKNLAYRLRVFLKRTLDLQGHDFILYKHGAYTWNPDIQCRIDIDVLEESYKMVHLNNISEEEMLEYYQKIIHIYKGGFLPHSSYKEWVVPLSIYYQRIYMEVVEKYCEIFLNRKDYITVEEVCRNAIAIDPFVETNHIILLKAFIGCNQYKKATEHYNSICKLFYDELGVKPSESVTKIYKDLLEKKFTFEKDLALIKADFKEANEAKGAIYYDYDIFKSIYQLEARAALRTGKSIFIILMTVTDNRGRELNSDSSKDVIELIKSIIVKSLRKSDIVTRYGQSQFLLMLSNITYENSSKLQNKLIKNINSGVGSNRIKVNGQIQPLDPIELEDKNVPD